MGSGSRGEIFIRARPKKHEFLCCCCPWLYGWWRKEENPYKMRLLKKVGSVAENFKEEPLITPYHTPKCFYGTVKPSTSFESLNLSPTSSPKTSTSSGSSCISTTSTSSKYSQTTTASNSTIYDQNGQKMSYKKRTKFCCRRSEYFTIHQKHPDKIPIIVEKFKSEKRLPDLVRCQYVVPKNTTVGQLQHIIRQKMGDNRNMPVYILVSNAELPSLITTMAVLHEKFHDEDGFLYVSFSSEDSFG